MQDPDHNEATFASGTYLSQILQEVRIVVFIRRGFEELSQFIQNQNNWSLTGLLRYVLDELAIALGRAFLFCAGPPVSLCDFLRDGLSQANTASSNRNNGPIAQVGIEGLRNGL